MFGPRPDPRMVPLPAGVFDDVTATVLCLAVALALTVAAAWRRPGVPLRGLLFIAGQVVLWTTPWLAWTNDAWFGAYPTIDKEGSFLFYQQGVHWRVLLDPIAASADPAARLIGVHVGHLWVTEGLDVFLTSVGAFNAQALLYPALGWWAAWLLARELTGRDQISLVMSWPVGMGLHLFRDLNWYTIEKAAVFWLPLYLVALTRAARFGRLEVMEDIVAVRLRAAPRPQGGRRGADEV